MKTLPFILLMIMVGTLAASAPLKGPKKELLLTCQGKETFSRDNPRAADVLCLREEMESLIREGNIPIVIECDKDVAWIYLNDPLGRDYPEVDFDSDYFEIILDLFPLKINKELKKSLAVGNKAFMDALGVEYLIEDGEVISKIDYDKFENFMFWYQINQETIKKSWPFFRPAFCLSFFNFTLFPSKPHPNPLLLGEGIRKGK